MNNGGARVFVIFGAEPSLEGCLRIFSPVFGLEKNQAMRSSLIGFFTMADGSLDASRIQPMVGRSSLGKLWMVSLNQAHK